MHYRNMLDRINRSGAFTWYSPDTLPIPDGAPLAEPWPVPTEDAGAVMDRVHTLIALPRHLPELREDTYASFDHKVGAVVVRFLGGIRDVERRFHIGVRNEIRNADGEQRWVTAGFSHALGVIAVIGADGDEATVTVMPMPQETYEAITKERQKSSSARLAG